MVEDSKQEQVRAAIHEEEKKELKVVLETSARPQREAKRTGKHKGQDARPE